MPKPKPVPKTVCGLFNAVHHAVEKRSPSIVHRATLSQSETNEPGAYLLICPVPRAVKANIPSLGLTCIPAGNYIYAGSAYGPGGLSARISRHFKSQKKAHWHIDRVTRIHPPSHALAFPYENECELISLLTDKLDATPPFKGFGSSDCRRCYAHLLQLPS